jgi:uncharacterized membrane protein YkoI
MQMRNIMAFLVMTFALGSALSVFGQEKKVKQSELPPAVQKTAEEQSKGATVKGYSQEKEDGQVVYEVALVVNGHGKDISIDGQGNVIEVEEEVDLKSLPAEVREGLQKQAGKSAIGKVESLTKRGTLVAYEAQVKNGKKHSEIQVGPDGKPLDHKE